VPSSEPYTESPDLRWTSQGRHRFESIRRWCAILRHSRKAEPATIWHGRARLRCVAGLSRDEIAALFRIPSGKLPRRFGEPRPATLKLWSRGFSPGFRTCLAQCPSRPRPSSSSAFRVTKANLPPLAFSIHLSSILANPPPSPQPRTRTIMALTVRGAKKLDK
jgi:hypothetical protein